MATSRANPSIPLILGKVRGRKVRGGGAGGWMFEPEETRDLLNTFAKEQKDQLTIV